MNRYVPILQEHVGAEKLELEELTDRNGTLSIVLAGVASRRIKLSFDSYMVYRKLDEGDALISFSNRKKTSITNQYFYRVEESDFIAWFNRERCDAQSTQPLVHYVIAAINDIVDVIAIDSPVVEVYAKTE